MMVFLEAHAGFVSGFLLDGSISCILPHSLLHGNIKKKQRNNFCSVASLGFFLFFFAYSYQKLLDPVAPHAT